MTATDSQQEGVQLVTLRSLVGHTISEAYRIDGIIGEGGMGIVFEANQLKLDRKVALKVLKLDGPNAQEAFARFEREIAILSNLSHPNIVRVLDSGRDSSLELYYIAMDLVTGLPLGDLSEGHRFAPALALEIIYQVAGALAQPHGEGVIHRDLKPDNVLLEVVADETVQVRLVDFGIARAFSADKKLTATGVVVGTPHYMAPELVREKDLDRRTDIYALGVMLHELLTGSLPFDGGNFMQIGFKHVQSEIPPLATKVDGLNMPDLENLVARMMAKEKEDRFDSVADLRRAIEQIIDDNGFPRVRVDPSKSVDEAIDHMRLELAEGHKAPDSAEWLPQSTPRGLDTENDPAVAERNAAAHKPLTTTTIENTSSSMVPLVVALIAVIVALVAVIVAVNVAQNSQADDPIQLGPSAGSEASEPSAAGAPAAPPETEEVEAAVVPEVATDEPAGGEPTTDEPATDDSAVAAELDQDTLEEADSAAEKPAAKKPVAKKPVAKKPVAKKPANTERKTSNTTASEKDPDEVKSFEEGLDWVSGGD